MLSGHDRIIVVTLFAMTLGLMGTFYPGMKINALDLSPNFAGTLMAIINGIGGITGILSPLIVGLLAPNVRFKNFYERVIKIKSFKKKVNKIVNKIFSFFIKQTEDEWRLVFWITLAVNAVTGLVYLFFGSGELQSWNNKGFENEIADDKKEDDLEKEKRTSLAENGEKINSW